MNQVQLATKLGVTRAMVTKWKGRGMPVGDLGKAKVWLAANVSSFKREARTERDLPGLRNESREQSLQDDTWQARVGRARLAERQADRLLQSAIKGGRLGQIQSLLMSKSKLLKELAGVEDMARTEEIKTGDMVHRESVKAMMEQLLRPLREALDKLPLNERTNCNPEHPEIAEKALTEWRDRLLLRAKSVEGKF